LHDAILALRPEWASAEGDDAEAEGNQETVVKIIMTGSADDGPDWQPHIRNKEKRRTLANRFKDSKDPFRIVIVRDMWLTGFDAPCLHTMYADKPMRGHGLMQAIARVNRVFREKPAGLIVDYLGLADQLRDAVGTYTASGGTGTPSYDVAQAIAVMQEKYEVACGILHGFDWSLWRSGSGTQKLSLIPAAQQHVLEQEDGKKRFIQVVVELSRACARGAARDEAAAMRDDVSFLQTGRGARTSPPTGGRGSPE
ncbi:MAG: UvrB domain 3-containing protein, partial [Planctomyces sp.]